VIFRFSRPIWKYLPPHSVVSSSEVIFLSGLQYLFDRRVKHPFIFELLNVSSSSTWSGFRQSRSWGCSSPLIRLPPPRAQSVRLPSLCPMSCIDWRDWLRSTRFFLAENRDPKGERGQARLKYELHGSGLHRERSDRRVAGRILRVLRPCREVLRSSPSLFLALLPLLGACYGFFNVGQTPTPCAFFSRNFSPWTWKQNQFHHPVSPCETLLVTVSLSMASPRRPPLFPTFF